MIARIPQLTLGEPLQANQYCLATATARGVAEQHTG